MSRDLEKQALIMEAKFARHLFWEFYALHHLWFKIGSGVETCGYSPIHSTIVSQSLRDKINYKFEAVTDTFFVELQGALEASIRSELKYPFGWSKRIPQKRNATRTYTPFDPFDHYKKYINKHAPFINIHEKVEMVPIWWGVVAFQWEGWFPDFCGPKWAEACRVYEDASNCHQLLTKVAWIDKVLDLEHNTGFILNKTGFGAIGSSVNINDDKVLDNDLDCRATLENWISAIGESKQIKKVIEISDDSRERDNIVITIDQETIPVSDWTRKVFMSQRGKLV